MNPQLIFDNIHILDILQIIHFSVQSPECLIDDICQIYLKVYSKPCFHQEIIVVTKLLVILIDLILEMKFRSENIIIVCLCNLILDLSDQDFNYETIIPQLCSYYKINNTEIFRKLLSDPLLDEENCEKYLFDIICCLKVLTPEQLNAIGQSKKVQEEISLLKKLNSESQNNGATIFQRTKFNNLNSPSDEEDLFYWE